MVPYSAPTGVLLTQYLQQRATLSRARGALFLSQSRRNLAQPLSLWTWSNLAVHALTATFAAGKAIVDENAARAAITEIASD